MCIRDSGKPDHKVDSDNLVDHLEELIRDKIKNKDKVIANSS